MIEGLSQEDELNTKGTSITEGGIDNTITNQEIVDLPWKFHLDDIKDIIIPKPEIKTLPESLMITGKVYDKATNGYGKELKVCVCKIDQSGGEPVTNVLASTISSNDGSYSLLLNEKELEGIDSTSELELFVFQGDIQLRLDERTVISLANVTEKTILKSIYVFTLPSVKGVLKRMNNVNAVGCLVELYYGGRNPKKIGHAITDTNGAYEISYNTIEANGLFVRLNLHLRYYNNEDLKVCCEDRTTVQHTVFRENNPTRVRSVSEKPYIGDMTIEKETNALYEVLSIAKEENNWSVTEKLISITEESETDKKYWKILKGKDGLDYKVLVKKVIYNTDYKHIATFTRLTEEEIPYIDNGSGLYQVIEEEFRCSSSPHIVTDARKEVVKFRFTNYSLDLYTRLRRREEQLLNSQRIQNKSYLIEESPYIASLIGASVEDLQTLGMARDFNNSLKLDHEDVFFALLKKGCKTDISTFFTMSNEALISKLRNAVDENIIPNETNIIEKLDKLKDKLVQYKAECLENLFGGISDTVVKAVLSNEDKRLKFVQCLVGNSYEDKRIDDSFWEKLNFLESEEKQLRLAVEYSDLCDSNELFINLFVKDGVLQSLDNLLSLTKDQIQEKIESSSAKAAILNFEGLADNLRVPSAFAEFINDKIELFHATRSLFLRLKGMADLQMKHTESNANFNLLRKKLILFLEGNPSHTFNIQKDITRDYIDKYEKTFVDPVVNLSLDKERWIEFMNLIQRIYSLTKKDRFETLVRLLNNNFKSAFDIVKTGKNNFYSKTQSVLDAKNQAYIYNSAELKVNKALLMLSNYSHPTNSGNPGVIKSNSAKLNSEGDKGKLLTLPELKVLFGDQDVTDTKHAESVLGPAAYLVDILNLLKEYKCDESKSLYDKLIDRRPDIAEIPLNCENALTTLPYLDLVIEILENEVVKLADITTVSDKQAIKFNTTKGVDDLVLEPENCIYEVYDKIESTPINSWQRSPFALKVEELKLYMSALGVNRSKLIEQFYENVEGSANPYFDALGLSKQDLDIFPLSITEETPFLDFINKDVLIPHTTAGFTQDRLMVGLFLEKTGMSLDTFEQVLTSYYVNPCVKFEEEGELKDARKTIHYNGRIELKTAYIEFITTESGLDFMKRMYQFQRLLNVTQWSIPVLDSVILANDKLKAYYGIDASKTNSLLDLNCVNNIGKVKQFQLSLDLSDNQVSGLFGSLDILEYEEDESFIYSYFIDNNLAELQKTQLKAFTTVKDEKQLVKNADGSYSPFVKYLQSVMQIDDKELKEFLYLVGETVYKQDVLNLMQAWQLMSILNMSVSDFISLCKIANIGVASKISEKISDLLETYQILMSHDLVLDEMLYLLKNEVKGGSSIPKEEDLEHLINNIFAKKAELGVGSESLENLDLLKAFVVEEFVKISRADKEVVDYVVNTLSLDSKILIDSIVSGSEELLTETIKKYVKALIAVDVFQLTKDDLIAIYASQLTTDDLNIDKTPLLNIFELTNNVYDEKGYSAFRRFISVCYAGKFLKADTNRFDLYTKVLKNNVENINWDIFIDWSDMFSLWKHNKMFALEDNSKYNSDLKWFTNVGEVHLFCNERNLEHSQAIQLLKWDDVSNSDIDIISECAKQHLGNDVYYSKVSEGRNAIREKQRDALVQYILEKELSENESERRIKDVNDLYSYFLIDTQMTSAVSSSRIVQATLAIQLFIQRIQFNLEPGIILTKNNQKRWEWMSRYRVWEANRKIFLYPENWLEPELRDNKTPFFKELEKELTSNELTNEVVEKTYMDYISKLEDVANIEFCQMYNEVVGSYSTLHVVGRTKFDPREYYYRKLINESHWTPWEKMNIQINSEHVAPVVIKDRLVVFWLEFLDEAKEPSDSDLSVKTEAKEIKRKKAQKQLRIKICWSEYLNNKWSEKREGDHDLVIDDEVASDKMDYRFVYDEGDVNRLHILVPADVKISDSIVKGVSYTVESYNQIHINREERFTGDGYCVPDGMCSFGQKMKQDRKPFSLIDPSDYNTDKRLPLSDSDARIGEDGIVEQERLNSSRVSIKSEPVNKDWIALKVPSKNGSTSTLDIVEDITNDTSVLYPHQYKDFACNAPFVVENNKQTIVLIPTEREERKSSVVGKISKVKASGINRISSYNRPSSVKEQEFYTDAFSDLSIIINKRESQAYRNEKIEEPILDVVISKSVMNANLGYHPFMGTLRSVLQKYGIEGLLDPSSVDVKSSEMPLLEKQANSNELTDLGFNKEIVTNVIKKEGTLEEGLCHIAEQFEFKPKGAYSIYNWEMFFHVPYIISNRYYLEGNYKEAFKWIHYVFDPRVSEGNTPDKYWKFKPFADYNATEGIDDLLFDLSMTEDSDPENLDLNDQIDVWSNDPFKPHNIAQIRVSAYMKSVVMRYLDILIASGDKSFRLDTMESVNEASQYYILGAQLLGRRPDVVETSILKPKTYSEFESDGMGNGIEYFEEALIKPENSASLEKHVEANEVNLASNQVSSDKQLKGMVTSIYSAIDKTDSVAKQYFGIPKNDKMFGYWDKVADRLFKIRNSLNINGYKRTLALFAPPIDPGMLARGAAAGIDIYKIVNGGACEYSTQYRFQTVLQKALDICNEVKSLGAGLLSALEKKDNEKISELRANHEVVLTEMLGNIKDKNIEDATVGIKQLQQQKKSVEFRKAYYKGKKKISRKENQQLDYMDKGIVYQVASQAVHFLAGSTNMIPNVVAGASGFGGSPHFTLESGGKKVAHTGEIIASGLNTLSSISNHMASRSGIVAGYERRKDEWDFQAETADRELAQLDKQILSAQIRKEIAILDKKNHDKQLQQSKDSYEILKSKFTNEDLYMWMIGEINTLYLAAFDLAIKMAKQAEASYNFELCPEKAEVMISNNHFDANNKGLLAGEKLYLELKQMESEYLINNTRKYELKKDISLAQLNPEQVLFLREKGSCEIKLPEIIFDMDHPGHKNRRVKSVSLTIPCVTGAYTSVSANLMLTNPKAGVIGSMATSSSINDSGMFEFNFNDSRYLPFEGADVDSSWTLSLPDVIRQFDYNSISDVILHINYTADEGGNKLDVEARVERELNEMANGNELVSMFSLKSQYPEAWAKLENGDAEIEIKKSQLAYFLQKREICVTNLTYNKMNYKKRESVNITDDLSQNLVSQKVTIHKSDVEEMPKDIIVLMKYKTK